MSWDNKNGIGWSMDLNEDSENDIKSLIKLISQPPKFSVIVGNKVYVKGKQYARPFTYIHLTYLGKATLDFASSTPFDEKELYKFSVTLNGFGNPSDQ